MSLTIQEDKEGEWVISAPQGRFDFTLYEQIALELDGGPIVDRDLILDLSQVTAIDSAAIGMLLQLHTRFAANGPLRVINCQPAVRSALQRVDCPRQLRVE